MKSLLLFGIGLLLGVVSVPLWPAQAEVAGGPPVRPGHRRPGCGACAGTHRRNQEDDDASEQSVQLAEADYARGYCRSVPWRLVGYRHTWSEAEQMMATELTRLERLVPPSSLASFHRQRIARDRLRLGIVAGRAAVKPKGKYDRIDIQPAWLSDTRTPARAGNSKQPSATCLPASRLCWTRRDARSFSSRPLRLRPLPPRRLPLRRPRRPV